MTRKGRKVSAEETALWDKVAQTATPLDRTLRKALLLKEHPLKNAVKPHTPVAEFRVGKKSTLPQSETRLSVPTQPILMDRKTFAKLRRGKSRPEARLDLHGMTVDVAHSALQAFLLKAHGQGKRLVLVITGKGRSREDADFLASPTGILRRQVPNWLEQPPLRQIVLQTSPAHQRHGGSGALYIYLRR